MGEITLKKRNMQYNSPKCKKEINVEFITASENFLESLHGKSGTIGKSWVNLFLPT
jgi:hypothetical protein